MSTSKLGDVVTEQIVHVATCIDCDWRREVNDNKVFNESRDHVLETSHEVRYRNSYVITKKGAE